MKRLPIRLVIAAWLVVGWLAPAVPVSAADGVVGSGSAGSCTESAFDTVLSAVQSSGGGVVSFNCGPTAHTIILSNQKLISADVDIRGSGLITLSGGNTTSLFQVFNSAALTLRAITITRGYGPSGAIESFGRLDVSDSQLTSNASTGSGGAITAYGDLAVTNTVFSDNTAGDLGGALNLVSGAATVADTQFLGNQAVNGGGAIAAGGTSLVISRSHFNRNRTTATLAEGGAIRSVSSTTISDSSFALNFGSRGGGVFANGAVTVTRSTFDTNWSFFGGGIRQAGGSLSVMDSSFTHNGYTDNGVFFGGDGAGLSLEAGTAALTGVVIAGNAGTYGGGVNISAGTLTLTNATFSGNTALGSGALDQGGGTVNLVNVTVARNRASFFAAGIASRFGTLTAKNVLLSGNVHPDTGQSLNCYKALPADTFSLSSDATCALEIGRNSLALPLEPLAMNGGLTATHLLPAGSLAIEAGTGIGCPATDQRGVARPLGAACDVGAVEATAADFVKHVYLPLLQRSLP